MNRHQLDQLLKRHGLVRLECSEVINRAFEVFQQRTRGLAEVAWQSNNHTPDAIATGFEQFGFDCYTQGLVDAFAIARDFPQLFEAALTATTTKAEGE